MAGRTNYSTDLEVETTDTQTFLSQQHKVLDMYRAKNEDSREDSRARNVKKISDDSYGLNGRAAEPKVLEHIGPVQFNMGGIQVDADDMVQRLMVSLACPLPAVLFELELTPFPGPPSLRQLDRSAKRPRRRRRRRVPADGHGEPTGLLYRSHEQETGDWCLGAIFVYGLSSLRCERASLVVILFASTKLSVREGASANVRSGRHCMLAGWGPAGCRCPANNCVDLDTLVFLGAWARNTEQLPRRENMDPMFDERASAWASPTSR